MADTSKRHLENPVAFCLAKQSSIIPTDVESGPYIIVKLKLVVATDAVMMYCMVSSTDHR